MDVSNLLTKDTARHDGQGDLGYVGRQYSTRQSLTSHSMPQPGHVFGGMMASPSKQIVAGIDGRRSSPSKQQKHVTFELLLPEAQNRARLPMRVMISPHDTTDSIITTVRNFYGLYEGPGVVFQDREGNVLIATYENFEHNMIVYVRMTASEPNVTGAISTRSRSITASPRKPKLGAPFEMRPPISHHQHPSRPASRTANRRSLSPQSIRSHRSVSTAHGVKSRSRSHRSRDNGLVDADADGYSDSDGGNGSVSSSRREVHASAEISVENIVEGGRRKRAKFDSSELPLFVPPQVPAANSISSVSPQRRMNGETAASPFSYPNQRTFAFPQPMPSPQSYGRHEAQFMGQFGGQGQYGYPQPPTRTPITYGPPRQSTGGILPTPEPTVGSVISDEDVALQLMRLGDASNISHGRTSTSTVDDALSGKADAASSDGEGDDEDEELPRTLHSHRHDHHNAGPRRKKQRVLAAGPSTDSIQSSGDEYEDRSFKGESDEILPGLEAAATGVGRSLHKSKSLSSSNFKSRGSMSSANDMQKTSHNRMSGQIKSKPKTAGPSKIPMSPSSLPSQSRKASLASTINFQHQFGLDEEDLSSKPRCQRCRKSKKGCDRQRPCGRCKDAGIGADGCVSEDEGNGRKGRYGRHMGVPLKKTSSEDLSMPMPPPLPQGQFLTPDLPLDKSKKRKR